jgi:hypothetical protein
LYPINNSNSSQNYHSLSLLYVSPPDTEKHGYLQKERIHVSLSQFTLNREIYKVKFKKPSPWNETSAVCFALKTTEKLRTEELYEMRSSRYLIKFSWQYWSNGKRWHFVLLIINFWCKSGIGQKEESLSLPHCHGAKFHAGKLQICLL